MAAQNRPPGWCRILRHHRLRFFVGQLKHEVVRETLSNRAERRSAISNPRDKLFDSLRLQWYSGSIAMFTKKFLGVLACLAVAVLIGSSAYEGFRKLGEYDRSGRTLGELSRLRSFVADYKVHHGSYPPDLSEAIPLALNLREHLTTSAVKLVSTPTDTAAINGALRNAPEDLGQWAYDSTNGLIFISCTHENHSRGRPWWSF
jgi:hypothetical protein